MAGKREATKSASAARSSESSGASYDQRCTACSISTSAVTTPSRKVAVPIFIADLPSLPLIVPGRHRRLGEAHPTLRVSHPGARTCRFSARRHPVRQRARRGRTTPVGRGRPPAPHDVRLAQGGAVVSPRRAWARSVGVHERTVHQPCGRITRQGDGQDRSRRRRGSEAPHHARWGNPRGVGPALSGACAARSRDRDTRGNPRDERRPSTRALLRPSYRHRVRRLRDRAGQSRRDDRSRRWPLPAPLRLPAVFRRPDDAHRILGAGAADRQPHPAGPHGRGERSPRAAKVSSSSSPAAPTPVSWLRSSVRPEYGTQCRSTAATRCCSDAAATSCWEGGCRNGSACCRCGECSSAAARDHGRRRARHRVLKTVDPALSVIVIGYRNRGRPLLAPWHRSSISPLRNWSKCSWSRRVAMDRPRSCASISPISP